MRREKKSDGSPASESRCTSDRDSQPQDETSLSRRKAMETVLVGLGALLTAACDLAPTGPSGPAGATRSGTAPGDRSLQSVKGGCQRCLDECFENFLRCRARAQRRECPRDLSEAAICAGQVTREVLECFRRYRECILECRPNGRCVTEKNEKFVRFIVIDAQQWIGEIQDCLRRGGPPEQQADCLFRAVIRFYDRLDTSGHRSADPARLLHGGLSCAAGSGF
ncbi:MAG: hypothetical protein ABR599_10215 [Gemmatimonadota bacterium]